jgi:hypothetical protein
MNRSYYNDTISNFLIESKESVLGKLNSSHRLENLNIKQTYAWEEQIIMLKTVLYSIKSGKIYFEFSIPRIDRGIIRY